MTERPRRLTWAWRIATSLLPSRRSEVADPDVGRIDHPGHTRRMRLRFGERLRDLFRPAWLRMARRDDGPEWRN